MCELTLEALGYREEEATLARRIFDLTTPREKRAKALNEILSRSPAPSWQPFNPARMQSLPCVSGISSAKEPA